MSAPSRLRRWPAPAAVIAGVALFALGMHGVTHVDTRLEVAAATHQQVASAKAKAKAKKDAPRQAKRDRKRV